MTRVSLVLLVLFYLLAPTPSQAQGHGKEKKKHAKAGVSAEAVLEVSFTIGEKQTIIDWFGHRDNVKGLPPGLAKRGELPPGLAKQLAERGTLPPGLQKKVSPLPAALERRLPLPPPGTVRVILSGQVILYGKESGRIFDVIQDVFELASD